MKALESLKSKLVSGEVYRRADLAKYSNAIDRHLSELQKRNELIKLSGGLYYRPKKSVFGEVPPAQKELVTSFLKDSRFLIYSYNDYHSLNLGTTQLYNETIIYNHKRHGVFKLGNQTYHFVRKHFFPITLSDEFLIVDMLNNWSKILDDKEKILFALKVKLKTVDMKKLKENLTEYGGVKAKNFFLSFIDEDL